MIIYNVTLNVDDCIHEQWRAWIQVHIPKVLATGLFLEAKLTKVLLDNEEHSTTYSVQYRVKSRAALEEYYTKYASDLRTESHRLFGDKVLAFRTELEVIDEFSVDFN